jgi:hypothetical protein
MKTAMKKCWLILLSSCLAAGAVHGENLRLADNGQAQMVILEQPGATPSEKTAARELAIHLEKITGARFELKQWDREMVGGAIVVGPGPAARKLFPEVALESFENEELIRLTRNGNLLLAGGRPRGTLYAVFRFLDQECGARWWAPWAASIPEKPRLEIAPLSVREKPAFEYREPFWYSAFDGRWAARNYSNGHRAAITPDWGGKIVYRGFVHTFNALVPPEKYFASHPEWFSFIDGKRAAEQSQLCLTNPELLDFVTDRVKTWLREAPENVILSISQNDWYRNCQCPDCRAIDEAEGSPSGSLLQFVNGVADRIAPEFPRAAIDTLAYQYTRRPPKTLRPRPNVIIRLCSIECNFAVPLEHPDNAAFAEDIRGWAEICDRLYVWDYTTDFAHYLQPHPNWFVLGPNARFFHRHKVRGLFEQGAYQSHGAEMAELRAWVLARLLWDPQQDDRALIREFLEGYHGAGPAAPIEAYLELMSDAAKDFYLTCFSPADAPFLNFKTLAEAERLWQQAIQAAETDEQRWRARQGHVPVRYLFLARWSQLQRECFQAGESWPLPDSRKAVADEWLALATGPGPEGWTAVTHLNESGLSPQKFVERFAVDPSPAEVRKRATPP